MKTTVEIADDVLRRAKRVAASEGVTLRDLIESGLRRELVDREQRDFVLVDASFQGRGPQTGIGEGDWARLREMIYEGRGG